MKHRNLVVAAVAAALVYSLLVRFHEPAKLWDWFNTLIGTSLSFGLALLGSNYLFNVQASVTREDERSDLRKLLTAELGDIRRILSDSDRMEIHYHNGPADRPLITFVQPLVVEKAALSGLFSQLESENLLHAARKIRMYGAKRDFVLTVIAARTDEATMRFATRNLEETRVAILGTVEHVAREMDLQLDQQYPD
jgi:hypothetical protein